MANNPRRMAAVHELENQDLARMALIVKIAQSKDKIACIESLCKQPRQILQRYRTKVRLNKIDEMDAACLRYYARQPGHTSFKKPVTAKHYSQYNAAKTTTR